MCVAVCYSTTATVSLVAMVRVPAFSQLDPRLEFPEKVTVLAITCVQPPIVFELPVNWTSEAGRYTAPCIVEPGVPVITCVMPVALRLPKNRIPENGPLVGADRP